MLPTIQPRKISLLIPIVLLMMVRTDSVSAGTTNLTSYGPYSGDIRTLELGPVTPALHVGTFGGGVFSNQLVDMKYLTDLTRILPSPAFNCDSTSEIPHLECEVLVSLYNNTNGPGWAHQDGWLSSNTPCSWYGVTCEGGHVQELYLDNNKLSGSIPPELGDLASLQELYLGVPYAIPIDPLVHENAIALGEPASLPYLYPNANHLSGAIPPQLGNLTSLRLLALTDNQLSGAIPAQLGNLANLQMLALEYNQLSGAIPPELGSLASLQSLLLSENQLSGGIPPELGSLHDLSILCPELQSVKRGYPARVG